MGKLKAFKDDLNELVTLGTGILINEECVLSILPPILENIEECYFLAEKIIFIYKKDFLFVKKINRLANSSDISAYLESLVYKPNFKRLNRAKNYRFVIFELANKIHFLNNIPKLPQNIMEIFASKRGFIFEIKIYSFIQDKNYFLEITTVAKMRDDMSIKLESNTIMNKIHNGAPIFINMNDSLMMIGLYNFSKFSKDKNGYLLNYSTPFREIEWYQYDLRSSMITQETSSDSRKSVLSLTQSRLESYFDKSGKKSSDITLSFKESNMDYVEEIKKLNENICYKKGEIEYISLDLLLNQIATDDMSEFNNYDIKTAFLLQFDAFLREDMLLKKIRSVFNFNVKIMKKLPRSLILLSNQWMILRWKDDFFNNTYMIKEMKSFYQEILKLPEVMDYEELQIEKIIELLEQDNLFDAEVILQNLKNNKRHKGIHIKNEKLVSLRSTEYFNILVWPEMEIARQLSLYTHYQFSKIETKELLSSRWTKKNNYNDCPNVMSFSDRLNKIYLWVCEEILSYDKAKFRVQVWEKFLRIANSCRKINNFNDCCVIITALNSLPLKFMDKTKKRLSSDALNLFLELSNFISLENNYKLLREETKKTYGKPNIPFFGLYLRELAYIEEGPKYLNNGLINVVKIRRVGSILLELQEFKKNAYLFGKNNDLAFLSGPNPMTEDQLISLANKLEPVFILSTSKSITKRPTHTDLNLFQLNPTINEVIIEIDKEIYHKSFQNIIEDFFN